MRIVSFLSMAALLGITAFAAGAQAQTESDRKSRFKDDREPMGRPPGRHFKSELMSIFYPLGMIKHHAEDIALTDAQRKKMSQVAEEARAEIDQMSASVNKELKILVKLVKSEAPQKKIMAQMDLVFSHENKIKKRHMTMMIAIRKILTARQRAILDKIKAEHQSRRGKYHHHGPHDGPPCGGPGGGPPGGGPPGGGPPGGAGPDDPAFYRGN